MTRVLLCSCLMLATAAVLAAPVTLYVSPEGRDTWSGTSLTPGPNGAGPLASLTGARDALRRLRDAGQGETATVVIRGGTYRMTQPLVLQAQDGNVTYLAAAGEKPVFSGGRVITGWRAAGNVFVSDPLPALADGTPWEFRQLFVNGHRRTRARAPAEGFFHIVAKGLPARDPVSGRETPQDQTAFIFKPGDIKAWPDLGDVEVVFFHSWETARLRLASVDEANHVVHFTGPSNWAFDYFGQHRRYFVENVPEGLDAPGAWYLDRKENVLKYHPLPGEDMSQVEVVAPALKRLVELKGDPQAGLPIENVVFKGLTFSHEDWTLEPGGHSDGQAVVSAPAAIMADGALGCGFEGCEISHVGDYGIWLRSACQNCLIQRCRIHDLGVGGVRVGEASMPPSDLVTSHGNLVDNNHIFDGGYVYPAGVGVWLAQAFGNTISHNEVHDFNYSGMSIGWNWGDEPNRTHHNIIEFNHVHHVMRGALSDGGAIYTLGVAPGSVIRNNVFHDVLPFLDPRIGWGIYLDATSGQYRVENNVVYNTLSGGLMFANGGHEHVIQNNIFANFCDYALWPYWEARPNTFRRNIVAFSRGKLFFEPSETSLKQRLAAGQPLGEWDQNLYWNPTDPQFLFFSRTFADWQTLGPDRHSVIADPLFTDPEHGDFSLKPDSPALKIGFTPIDTSTVGLYGDPEWVAEARAVKEAPVVFPPPPAPPAPAPVDDDFEGTVVGAPPEGAAVSGEEQGASVRVTDEQAASGKHSVKLTKMAGMQFSWQPHMFYQPHFVTGTVQQSFNLRLGLNAVMFTEWRDATPYPDSVGPSVTFDAGHADAGGPAGVQQARVMVGGKVLMAVPLDQWVHVEIVCTLGKPAPKTFKLTVTVPGQDPKVFEDLPIMGTAFRELHWLGFCPNTTAPCVLYLDDVKVR